MNSATLIEKVCGELEAPAEQVVALAKKYFQNAETSLPQIEEEKFSGRNITLEEYIVLPREERRRYQGEAKKLNRRWIETQFKKLDAKWMMVIDSRIVEYGTTFDNYPEDDEFLGLCQKTGKYPFVFISPRVFAIEESSTAWHRTYERDDSYPVVAITLSDYNKNLTTAADFDTGAMGCYADLALLFANGIVKIQPQEFEDTSEHLSQPYVYFTKNVWLELADGSGTARRTRTTVICVEDWGTSPFTAINSTRTFLLGRSVLLKLKPRIILDFAIQHTEVQFAETV